MQYATNYDIGERKRHRGINEDSVAITVFEQGHRDGFRGQSRVLVPAEDSADGSADRSRESTDLNDSGGDSTDSYDSGGDSTESADERAETDSPPEPELSTPGESKAEPAETDPGSSSESGSTAAGDGAVTGPENRSAAVFALADGAGGHDAGDAASYIASTVICEQLAGAAVRAARSDPSAFDVGIDEPLPSEPSARDLQETVESAIVAAHRKIIEYAATSGEAAYTTVVAGVCVDGRLHYGWVGDSRAYVVNRDRGEIAQLTKDHAVVEQLHDQGEIDDVEAHVHPRGNEITRAVGGTGGEKPETASVSVETNSVELFAEDVVLVTSDGLIDAQTDAPELYDKYVDADRSAAVGREIEQQVVTDADIRDWVLDADSLDEAAAALIERANERGGKDNLSTLLFRDPALQSTPSSGGLPVRAIDPEEPIEDRETVIVRE